MNEALAWYATVVCAALVSAFGNYFLGFSVSWPGAFLGLAEAGVGGFSFGWSLARLINLMVGWHEKALLARLERRSIFRFLDEEVS